MEDRVGQELVGAQQRVRQRVRRAGVQRLDVGLDPERAPDGAHLGPVRGLVTGDRHEVGVHQPQVDAVLIRGGDDLGGPPRNPDGDRVEVFAVDDLGTTAPQPFGEDRRIPVRPTGDALQPLGPVVDGVHPGHHGKQHLGGTDVAGRLLATDVLLTRLQSEPVRLVPVRVDGHAHQPSGQAARELLVYGHVSGVRPAEAHRHTEPLRRTDRDVGTQLTRRLQQRQREQIGGDGDERAQLVRPVDDRLDVAYGTGGARVLDQHAVDLTLGELGRDALAEVGDDDLDAGRLGPRLDHGDGLRQRVRVDQEQALLVLAHPPGQRHRLGGGRALVEQRGTGGRQPGEVGDHGLEVQQRLEPPLGDLRLVRRVSRVPGRVLHDVPQDDGRREGPVVPEPDHGAEHLVTVGQRAQLGQHLGLGARTRQLQVVGVLDHIRHRGGGQLVEGAVADLREHLGPRLLVGPDVALLEGDSLFELGERNAVGGHCGGLLV